MFEFSAICQTVSFEYKIAVPFRVFLTQIKKSCFSERFLRKYLCAHTKGITFAVEKKKEG